MSADNKSADNKSANKTCRTPHPIVSAGNPAHLTAIVVGISAIAWLLMILLHSSGGTGHHLPLFVERLEGWTIMVMAMMLPPALPFLQAMGRLVSGLSRGPALVAAAAAAFVAAWILAGLALVVAGSLLFSLSEVLPWLSHRPALVNGLAALLAGAYQLSPLKQSCLTACRSPVALMLVAWKHNQPWRSAIGIGMRYALVCIGCCWALMLLTLVVGAFVLPLMVVVSVIMLLERLLPAVRSLIPLQAALACAIGLLLLLGSIPPGLEIGEMGIPNHHAHHDIAK